MRKLKKVDGMDYKYKKIVQNISEIDETIFINLIIDLYNLTDLKTTFTFLTNHDFQNLVFEIMYLIKNSEANANLFFKDLIQKNTDKIEAVLNTNKIDSLEKFKNLISGDIPVYNNFNISDSMYILYKNTSKNYNKQFYNLALEQLEKRNSDFLEKDDKKELEKIVKLSGVLKNSLVENELNMFLTKSYSITKEKEEECLENIAYVLNAKRNTAEKTITFNEGIGLFLYSNLESIERMKKTFEVIDIEITALLNNSFKKFLDNTKDYYLIEKAKEIVTENIALKNEIKTVSETEIIIDKKIIAENSELQKENYYLKNLLEKQEQKIKELEEELSRNKEIVEDLNIEIDNSITSVVDISDKKIIVLGGRWKGKKLQNSNIKTISAEDIFKNIDSLKNYDLVIFDTSRNSHTNFNKLKSVTKNYYLISKSSENEIMNLFQN